MNDKHRARPALEPLEDRVTPTSLPWFSATAVKDGEPYRPLQGARINLQATALTYRPGVRHQTVTVEVKLTDPNKDRGGFGVRLYWSDGQGRLTFAGEERFIKPSTPAWGSAMIHARFARDQVLPRPHNARYLVAVVDPAGQVRETSERDNVVALDANRNVSFLVAAPDRLPRTFAFLVAGFSTSSGETGMHRLAATLRDRGVGLDTIDVIRGALTGQATLAAARSFIEGKLREYGAGPDDRVILIGHSYGGDVVRRLAADVRRDLPGDQPAAALVTLDAIDYELAQGPLKFNQSEVVRAVPQGLAPDKVLNIVQRTAGQTLQGYSFDKKDGKSKVNNTDLANGPDRRKGTRDDLTHTGLDEDGRVHQAVVEFLSGV